MTVPLTRKTLAFSYLRQALADSPTFQAWVGATGDPETALLSIHVDALPRGADADLTLAELSGYRPFAILRDETFASQPEAWPPDTTSAVTIEGTFSITLEAAATAMADNYTVYLDFHNVVGEIMEDLWKYCIGTAERHLIPRRIELEEGHYRADDDQLAEEGDFVSIQITIVWGPCQ